MDFSKHFLKAKRPCTDGFRWYIRHCPDVSNYQETLDALVADGRASDACWLLDQFGPTDGVRELDSLDAEAMVFAGTLIVRGNIDAGQLLRCGRALHVGGGIRCGGDLRTGEDLRCEGALHVGGQLEVGGDLRVHWSIDAQGDVSVGGELRSGWGVTCGGGLALGGNAHVGGTLQAGGEVGCGKGLQCGEDLIAARIRAVQGILAGQSIDCGTHLEAGWGIRAGDAIAAGGAIRSGEGLEAGGEIRAGRDYGIFAGLDVQRADWESSARIVAARRPDALMSGLWTGPEAGR